MSKALLISFVLTAISISLAAPANGPSDAIASAVPPITTRGTSVGFPGTSKESSAPPTNVPTAGGPPPTTSFIPVTATVSPASPAPNDPQWSQDTTETVEAINGGLGATVIAPDNLALDQQNPDVLAPPTTDNGDV